MLNYTHLLSENVKHPSSLKEAVLFQASMPRQMPEIPEDQFLTLKDKLRTVIDSLGGKWNPLKEFELKALDKWWGIQGISFPYEALTPGLELYYTRSTVYPRWNHPVTPQVHRLLNRSTLHCVGDDKLVSLYTGDHKSNSGLTGWTDRRTPGLAITAATEAIEDPDGYDPVVLGQKYERNKLRTIFMDSFANYFRAARSWYPLHHAFNGTHVHWGNHGTITKTITDFMAQAGSYVAIEGDAEAMDTWMDLSKISSISRWITRATDKWYDAFEGSFALWNQPVLTPQGWVTGHHSLFSGEYPTNDCESIWSANVCYDFINRKVEWKVKFPTEGKDYLVVVLGDDWLILLRRPAIARIPTNSEVAEHMIEHGLLAKEEKQRVAVDEGAFFCKRYYSLRHGGSSLYPVALAVNSLVHPRDGGDFLHRPGGIGVTMCQLMDNVSISHPLYGTTIDILQKTFKGICVEERDVDKYNESGRNWLQRTLGLTFSLKNSPTYAILSGEVHNKFLFGWHSPFQRDLYTDMVPPAWYTRPNNE